MANPRPSIRYYHDTRNTYKKSKLTDLFPVKIRVGHLDQVKFFPSGIDLTVDDFNKINGKRPSPEFKHIKRTIDEIIVRFESIVKTIPAFSFSKLERALQSTNKDLLSVTNAFKEKIAELEAQDKFSSASLYKNVNDALSAFRKRDLKFHDIDSKFLDDFQKHLEKTGRANATIGIYMRNLRHIFNRAIKDGIIHQTLYPFNSYKIPVSRNIKKAIPIEAISKIYFTDLQMTERSRLGIDLFVFSFATEGMNFKDILHLKKTDIEDNLLKFKRAKTKETRRDSSQQIVYLPELSRTIIDKYFGNDGPYVFPVLDEQWTPQKMHNHVKWFIKDTNTKLREVAMHEDIPGAEKISTYYARHSYATATIKNGYSIEFLKEKLGHSSVKVTQSYIASFGLDIDKEASDKLLKGFQND
ncbi:MAG TPA: site-specific integrase [Saprospiraceae bacterium]|nr:site-specific integrase [Saprospiraceae bacterium]HPN69794.1 site-specific integrase [Saprospiraceae bacterium]